MILFQSPNRDKQAWDFRVCSGLAEHSSCFNPLTGISKLGTAGDGSALGERGEWAMCEHLAFSLLRTPSEGSIASLSRAVKPLQQRSGGFASGSRGFVRASPLAKSRTKALLIEEEARRKRDGMSVVSQSAIQPMFPGIAQIAQRHVRASEDETVAAHRAQPRQFHAARGRQSGQRVPIRRG